MRRADRFVENRKRWAEVLDYDAVYQRVNGELINYVRKRHLRPRKKASARKLRLAKVG